VSTRRKTEDTGNGEVDAISRTAFFATSAVGAGAAAAELPVFQAKDKDEEHGASGTADAQSNRRT
jgi:hypothetical protein